VYFGWVGLSLSTSTTAEGEAEADHATDDGAVYPCVLSVGFNPFYKNTVRSVEIHILHEFGRDFYGAALNLLMLGFIRPEYDYVSLEALVDDIRTDCDVATRSLLERDAYARFKNDPWLREFGWMKDEKKTEP
jgi:riboflavin kinase